jgi:hypothetical protein
MLHFRVDKALNCYPANEFKKFSYEEFVIS